MICYVCHSEAVGQCKDCGRFYCSDHGDIHCVKCRRATSSPGKVEVLGQPKPAVPACHYCQGTAAGACTACGKFYCSEHGKGYLGGVLCEPCCNNSFILHIVGLPIIFIILCCFGMNCQPMMQTTNIGTGAYAEPGTTGTTPGTTGTTDLGEVR